MNTFPAQGMNTTYDLTSAIPDSASTATALSTGYKTASGVINMDPAGQVGYKTITEVAKDKGWKVGILSTVSFDHATPAAFYAHQPSAPQHVRHLQWNWPTAPFDYFAGGQMKSPTKEGNSRTPSTRPSQTVLPSP